MPKSCCAYRQGLWVLFSKLHPAVNCYPGLKYSSFHFTVFWVLVRRVKATVTSYRRVFKARFWVQISCSSHSRWIFRIFHYGNPACLFRMQTTEKQCNWRGKYVLLKSGNTGGANFHDFLWHMYRWSLRINYSDVKKITVVNMKGVCSNNHNKPMLLNYWNKLFTSSFILFSVWPLSCSICFSV